MVRCFLNCTAFLSLMCLCSWARAGSQDVNVAREITKLIPHATAMQRADFEKLARSATAASAGEFSDKSLTLMLLSIRVDADRSEERQKEFAFLCEGLPRPDQLAAEMQRSFGSGQLSLPLGPVTLVHANRITDVTCEVDGDTATGTVAFEVPELYRGRVNYVASKQEGRWQITEFKMPAHQIHVVRDKEGTWSLRSSARER